MDSASMSPRVSADLLIQNVPEREVLEQRDDVCEALVEARARPGWSAR